MIRPAVADDIPRLAEILIFAKRTAYRPIFRNDIISFNRMQVVPLAREMREKGALDGILVYDDGIVKGMMKSRRTGYEACENSLKLCELYVDPFFQHCGIGHALMGRFFREAGELHAGCVFLWVLEKNRAARDFYEKCGFFFDGTKRLENSTEEYVLRYSART